MLFFWEFGKEVLSWFDKLFSAGVSGLKIDITTK